MKTLSLLLVVLFCTVTVSGQYLDKKEEERNKKPTILGGSFGVTFTSIEALEASSSGFSIGFDALKYHLGISFNGAKGKGEYLDYESDETYELNKRMWYMVNFGRNILVFDLKKENANVFLRPKIGFVGIENIYNDPVAFDTFFTEEYKTKFSLAADLIYQTPDDHFFLVIGGPGLVQNASIEIGFCF